MDMKEIEEWWRGKPVVCELKRPIFGYWVDVTDWLISRIKELEGTQWDRIANDLTEAKSENAKSLARVGELEDYYARVINEPCPMDQKHCTCVPALRMRIDELEGAIRKHKDIDEWESVYGNRDEELYAHLKEREDER